MSHFLIYLFFLLASASVIHADNGTASSANTTHLHFYLHDILSGSNPTAIPVAQGPTIYRGSAPFGFGTVVVIDDVLTEGPNLTSNVVGRAQGFYSNSALSGTVIVLSINIVLTGGEFNGSTVAVFGRDYVLETVRELPVIGGTGKFRMARGFALIKTSFANVTTGDAVLEFDLYVSDSSSNINEIVPSSDGSNSDGDVSPSSTSTSDGIECLHLNLITIFAICCVLSKHLFGDIQVY